MIKQGIYGEKGLLGAKVRVISSPGFELFGEFSNDKLYFIEKIEYRVDPDGKFRPGISLVGLENRKFRPEDLCIIEIPECKKQ